MEREGLESQAAPATEPLGTIVDRVVINEALLGLPEEFREMIVLHYFQGMKVSEAASLYEKRLALLKEELAGQGYLQKEYPTRQYEKFGTPLYYGYADGWKALLDSQYLPTLMTITIVIIGFWVSGVFSCEFQLGADSVFFTSNYGCNRAIHMKIKAGFLMITVAYWAAMLTFSLLVLGLLGFQGAGLMIQTNDHNWSCMYNITYTESWLLTMSGGDVAHLFDFSDNIIVIPTGIC